MPINIIVRNEPGHWPESRRKGPVGTRFSIIWRVPAPADPGALSGHAGTAEKMAVRTGTWAG